MPASQVTTISKNGTLQHLNVPPANIFNKLNQRDESQPQVVSGAYDPSNVFEDADQDESRNSEVQYPDA
jgi:hypothetical protein